MILEGFKRFVFVFEHAYVELFGLQSAIVVVVVVVVVLSPASFEAPPIKE